MNWFQLTINHLIMRIDCISGFEWTTWFNPPWLVYEPLFKMDLEHVLLEVFIISVVSLWNKLFFA